MAIKVRHEGNLTSRVVAGQGGGAAKRAMESAALIRPRQVQLTYAATAQAHAPSGGSAQLIHAPLGGGGGAPLIHAPANPGSGSGSSRSSYAGGSGAPGGDYKVTGTSVFSRPDAESQWDPGNGGRWIRPWQPGEKEAEAKARIGAVEEQFQIAREDRDLQGKKELEDRALQGKKDLAEFQYTQNQRQQYAKLQDMRDTLLNSGIYSEDDVKAMMPALEARMNGIRDNPERMLPQDRRPVPELQFSPDGKFYFDDAGGRWTPVPETGFKITPAESFQQQRQLGAERAYYTALQNWRTAKAKYDADQDMNPDPGPQPTMQDFVGQIQSAPAATPGLPVQSVGLNTNVVPQGVSQPVYPNQQAIQSVGPDATPEEKAKRWAARLRKQ